MKNNICCTCKTRTQSHNIKDNIWFTYKARIQAHKRLEWLDFHSQLLLVWYAILSTALGVLTIKHTNILGQDTDILATILSVILLGVSLTVTNLNFGIRAKLFRDNYLELQRLYQSINEEPTSEQIEEYHDILKKSENHKESDDRTARVFATVLNSRHPTNIETCISYLWIATRFIFITLLYSLPVIIGLIYYWRGHE